MKHTLTLLAALLLASCVSPRVEDKGKAITDVFVDVSRIRHDTKSWGDTWDHIWAGDGHLYTFGCDGGGYGTNANNNINFNKLTGAAWDQLVGSLINPMSEYGKNGSYLAENSTQLVERNWSKPVIPRGPNWKVTGADCIDGVFYAFVAGNWYGNQNAYGGTALDPYLRQTVNNMSLIKSTDKGLTWTRPMAANAAQPMWTNKMFSTAFFFKYGQNGGNTRQDDQDKFVYAISNDGYWNCGSAFYLGRVPRAKIGNLNVADWQYFSDGKWTGELGAATPVPGLPNGQNKCTMGSPVWLSALKKYVTVTWFDPCTTTKWHYPDDVTFAFHQAEHPWGPWSYIGAKSAMEFIGKPGANRIHRWYGPTLSPKFIAENSDGSVTAILLFSGQTWENKPDSLYKNNSCPVTFYTRPLPKLCETANDTAAHYSDGWRHETKRGFGDYQDDVHVTEKPGSYCDFEFVGEGIEILSEKFHDMGDVEVLLDGTSQGIFHLYQDPMPRLYQIPFYRKMDLAKGRHTVRVINRATSGILCIVDAFKVYGAP
jgi:hypothetical protein